MSRPTERFQIVRNKDGRFEIKKQKAKGNIIKNPDRSSPGRPNPDDKRR